MCNVQGFSLGSFMVSTLIFAPGRIQLIVCSLSMANNPGSWPSLLADWFISAVFVIVLLQDLTVIPYKLQDLMAHSIALGQILTLYICELSSWQPLQWISYFILSSQDMWILWSPFMPHRNQDWARSATSGCLFTQPCPALSVPPGCQRVFCRVKFSSNLEMEVRSNSLMVSTQHI